MACGPGCGCDCCAGFRAAATPRRPGNPPGLPAIAYRAGGHASFLASMKARLSSADHPALVGPTTRKKNDPTLAPDQRLDPGLTTRESSDASIALMDALAASLDVLSFYTERAANEHYLRTATERLSLIEMARLIGYRPAPGVAASTHLAFTLQNIPGAPAEPITIPVGTRVQSVPGQDEKPQVFETVAPAPARVEWNAIPARTTRPWMPALGDTVLWLAGVATRLEPGDAILIVGAERANPKNRSAAWAVRVLRSVTPDPEAGRTRVEWADPLSGTLPAAGVEVHALRQRAALFGHNAPDPNLLGSNDAKNAKQIDIHIDKSDGNNWKWKNFIIDRTLDIDPRNEKIVSGSWVVLVSNGAGGTSDLPGVISLFRTKQAAQMTRQDFAISSKITRVTPDASIDASIGAAFDLRETLVLAQSERLETVDTPLFHPVHGDVLTLDHRIELAPERPVAISGKRQSVMVASGATDLNLLLDNGHRVPLIEGDRLFMAEAATKIITIKPRRFPVGRQVFGHRFGSLLGDLPQTRSMAVTTEKFTAALGKPGFLMRLRLIDRDGRIGTLIVSSEKLALGKSLKDDESICEIAFVADGIDSVKVQRDHTILKLTRPLRHIYERASLRLNANVAPATHGESVETILGNGDGRLANQRFRLNQAPLTHVSAGTPSGRASTLEVRVNDVLWAEAPTLYRAASHARAYETVLTDDGYTTVQFGDGIEGARLPSGATNIRARYRKGIGAGGNVAAGKITTLLSRPLGVAEAVNPSPAMGGEDAETLDAARQNAPLTVLTLDRAVSVADYRNLARAFAGIDKAHALWIPFGIARGVFLTIAGTDGAMVPQTGATYADLAKALRDYGDALVPIRIVNHIPARFRLRMAVKVLPAHLPDKVLAGVETALRVHFSFAARAFGQTVSVDEVAAVAQRVEGVEAAHVLALYREGDPVSLLPRIFARLPVGSLGAIPDPAELLTLSDAPLLLEAMT